MKNKLHGKLYTITFSHIGVFLGILRLLISRANFLLNGYYPWPLYNSLHLH